MTAVAVADGLGAVLVEASRRTGISFVGTRGAWLAEGLRAAVARGETDGRRWDEVFADDGVFVRLCDRVTVQESFFLRERSRFDLLTRSILPAIGELDRPLRLWSAGCAAGMAASCSMTAASWCSRFGSTRMMRSSRLKASLKSPRLSS